MTLTELVDLMEQEGRLPRKTIDAHRKTLEALVALARRVEELEAHMGASPKASRQK